MGRAALADQQHRQ